jgi:hypothetical protein
MVAERQRAVDNDYPSPIHDTITDTHQNYDDVSILFRQAFPLFRLVLPLAWLVFAIKILSGVTVR